MKCPKCGAEISDDSLFCRECGEKIIKKIKFCRECGSEINDGAKYCPNCGAEIIDMNQSRASNSSEKVSYKEKQCQNSQERTEEKGNTHKTASNESKSDSFFSKILAGILSIIVIVGKKILCYWKKMDSYCKVLTIVAIISIWLLYKNVLSSTILGILISIINIATVLFAFFIHKNIIKCNDAKIEKIVLIVSILLIPVSFSSRSFENGLSNLFTSNKDDSSNVLPFNNYLEYEENELNDEIIAEPEQTIAETNYTIEKGSQYAFMSDSWNVYIANAVSSDMITIEHWDRTLSDSKWLSYSEDIGTFKINDAANNFKWIDDSHVAFSITFADKNNSRVKKSESHIFTININEGNSYKGSDYDKNIVCYSYTNDDWHMYRAIPLSDNLMKFECWARVSSSDDFVYSWDWTTINILSNDVSFEWTDDEHTSFTVTTKDPKNSDHWKKDQLVLFELENNECKYPNVVTFLGLQELEEDEVKAPDSALNFIYKDYKDVKDSLSSAGFTNISTNIQYDIIFGWTKEGEVAKVSIDGDSDFDKGNVFNKDAEVVITYHMNYSDDPTRKEEHTSSNNNSSSKEENSNSEESDELYYTTNTKSTVKKGNSGVYAYKKNGTSYSMYYIIDFDNKYVYCFSDDTDNSICERLKIESGTLNDLIIVTYHDGGDEWSNALHFKWKNNPDSLVMEDNDHFTYDYYPTDLYKAINIRDRKTIVGY